jgi:hypothetical protein
MSCMMAGHQLVLQLADEGAAHTGAEERPHTRHAVDRGVMRHEMMESAQVGRIRHDTDPADWQERGQGASGSSATRTSRTTEPK